MDIIWELTMRWLQNYFCCNLFFLSNTLSSWRETIFVVGGLSLNHFAGFSRFLQKALNFA